MIRSLIGNVGQVPAHTHDVIMNVIDLIFIANIYHGHIIKWTQHIGFLTLDEMVRVIKGNHENDSKRS